MEENSQEQQSTMVAAEGDIKVFLPTPNPLHTSAIEGGRKSGSYTVVLLRVQRNWRRSYYCPLGWGEMWSTTVASTRLMLVG